MPEDFPCMPFIRTRQVAFHDTDASGVAHFSRLLCLVEEVEHEYLSSRGGGGSFPRLRLAPRACGGGLLQLCGAGRLAEHRIKPGNGGNQFSGMEICCISPSVRCEGKICGRPCGEGRQTSGNSGIGEGMPDFGLFKRRGCL